MKTKQTILVTVIAFLYTINAHSNHSRIGNYIWQDDNKNGLQDEGELPLEAITIALYEDNNQDGIADGEAKATVTTGEDGLFIFVTEPGFYFLEIQNENYQPTCYKNKKNTKKIDNNFHPVTKKTSTIQLKKGEMNIQIDGGLTPVTEQKLKCNCTEPFKGGHFSVSASAVNYISNTQKGYQSNRSLGSQMALNYHINLSNHISIRPGINFGIKNIRFSNKENQEKHFMLPSFSGSLVLEHRFQVNSNNYISWDWGGMMNYNTAISEEQLISNEGALKLQSPGSTPEFQRSEAWTPSVLIGLTWHHLTASGQDIFFGFQNNFGLTNAYISPETEGCHDIIFKNSYIGVVTGIGLTGKR